jgi:hypothetical protein
MESMSNIGSKYWIDNNTVSLASAPMEGAVPIR